jgi:hypothetical protein
MVPPASRASISAISDATRVSLSGTVLPRSLRKT